MADARLRLARTDIGFSAAHFSIHGGRSERLHGHNYTVAVEVHGPVGDDGTVVDFATLKRLLRELCGRLDERMLIPTRSPSVSVDSDGAAVRLVEGTRRFLIPAEDVVLLPIVNTTCECLAAHLLGELRACLGETAYRLSLRVEESPGQGAAATE